MNTYQLKVGAISCTVISDGASLFDAENLSDYFVNASEEEIQAARNQIGLTSKQEKGHMNPLLIEVQGQKVLVDTGMGSFGTDGPFNKLVGNMKNQGIEAASVDYVFITHFHGDHIGGLLDTAGKEVFPKAAYVTQQDEWDYWMSDETIASRGDSGQRYSAVLNPIKDKFKFVSNETEIVSGVKVLDAFGHTPGHSALLIESEGETLLHAVDLLHHPTQFAHPEWHHQFDSDKEQAVETRQRLLAYAADNNLLTLFYYLPFPGLGYVRHSGKAFKWEPIDI